MFIFDNSLILLLPDGSVDVFSLWGVLFFLGIVGVTGWAIFKIKAFLNMDEEGRSQKTKGALLRFQYWFLGISAGLILFGGGILWYEQEDTSEKSCVEAIRYMWWFRLFHKYSASCARGQVIEPDGLVYKRWCKFVIDGFGSYEMEKVFAVKDLHAVEQKFTSFRASRMKSFESTKLVTWFDFYKRYMLSCMNSFSTCPNDPAYTLWVEYNTTVLSEKELEQLLRRCSREIEYNFYRPQNDGESQR